MILSERLVDRKTCELDSSLAQERFRVRTGQNHSSFAIDQQQSLIQVADNLPKPPAHDLKLGPLPRQSLAQLSESRRDSRNHLVLGKSHFGHDRGLAGAELIDAGRY